MIDLYARNPYKHEIGEKVMGFDLFRDRRFICGIIVDRDHRGDTNAYIIESEYGKDHSGTLFESGILSFFDENILLRELEKDKMLTIKILYGFGVVVIVEKDGKEIFRQNIEGVAEPEYLLKSYEKLLACLDFKPLLDEMYMDDSLLILKFEKIR